MKFTTYQSEYITKYLIHEGLEYKEFIDEMHDHFCNSAETKMSEGLNFHQAIGATEEEFAEEIYQTNIFGFFPKKGLKAIEKKFYESKKREINAELKANLRLSPFTIQNALVLCYVGLVFYFLRGESSLQDVWLIYAWMLPSIFVVTYLRKALKANIQTATGVGWLFASKKERVRSVYINLLFHVSGNSWLSWFNILCVPLHYGNKYGYIHNDIYFYSMLFIITVTLLVQVQVIKMIPRVNKLINN